MLVRNSLFFLGALSANATYFWLFFSSGSNDFYHFLVVELILISRKFVMGSNNLKVEL